MSNPRKLSRAAFELASQYVKTKARPLDRAHFALIFEDGSADAVARELAAFQNPDGGFFRLEMDIRTKVSSPIATSIALQFLQDVRVDSSHPLVGGALQYLRNTYDPQAKRWKTIGPEVNDAPHAPWWTYDAKTSATGAGSPANPTAELAAAFLRYGPKDRDTWTSELVRYLLAHLNGLPDEMEIHDFACYARLYGGLSQSERMLMRPKLERAAKAIVTVDPAKWSEYGVKPLMLAWTSSSPVAAVLGNELDANLDWEIGQQAADGSWGPSWSWFGLYPEAWPEVEAEWRGHLTVRTLRQLREFARA